MQTFPPPVQSVPSRDLAVIDEFRRKHPEIAAVWASKAPAMPWRWRDINGVMHRPADMATSYLFNALRSIWNSNMPADACIPGVRRYTYDAKNYPHGYLVNAIRMFSREIATRDLKVLTNLQRTHLEHMLAYLGRAQLGTPESRRGVEMHREVGL